MNSHPRWKKKTSSLELEPEAQLSPVRVAERCTEPLASAVTLRGAKVGVPCAARIVESVVHIVAAVLPVKQVEHFGDELQSHAVAEVKLLRGAQVQLDECLPTEAVGFYHLTSVDGRTQPDAGAV